MVQAGSKSYFFFIRPTYPPPSLLLPESPLDPCPPHTPVPPPFGSKPLSPPTGWDRGGQGSAGTLWELVPTPPVGASYGASYLRQLPVSPPVTGHNWRRNWWQLAEKLVTTGGDSWRRNWRQLEELAPVEITL
jgi:hypothetical protein